MKKIRLDLIIVEKELSPSREKAKREIIAGWVKVNGETVRDPSKKFSPDIEINIERPGGVFVSRGGEKLQKALTVFDIDMKYKVAVDLGASTGGFTDCMLKSGARKVYSIDVGFNQLDYSLRIDERVVVMEKTHAKNIEKAMFSENIDFFSADLSFISVLKILPAVYSVFEEIEGVILLKPQFEAVSGEHKKGVVKDMDIHEKIITRVLAGIEDIGFSVLGVSYSPIKGPAGNIEFLVHLYKGKLSDLSTVSVHDIVERAHRELK